MMERLKPDPTIKDIYLDLIKQLNGIVDDLYGRIDILRKQNDALTDRVFKLETK